MINQTITVMFTNITYMSQLSKYIQKQLNSILNKIHETPPKKCASMKKIKTLVNAAPIAEDQKTHLNKSIKRIQSAMEKSKKQKTARTQYQKNLFFENMFLQQKNMNKLPQTQWSVSDANEIQYNQLMQKLTELRSTRLKRQQYLKQLIIKTQRMQRMASLRQQNQQKYLKSKMLQEQYLQKKANEQSFKKSIKQAAKNNKIRTVHNLVIKFNNYAS